MEHKKAANILISMLDKQWLDDDEREAVSVAIGVLSWTALAESKRKALKIKRDKQNEAE